MLALQRQHLTAEPGRFLDLEAFAAARLSSEPYPHLIVPRFVRPEAIDALNAEFPEIVGPGSFPPESLEYGPLFAAFIAALESPTLRAAFAAKFALDLAGRPPLVTVRGHIKQALIAMGFPAEDLAGYTDGSPLPFKLHSETLTGKPFLPRAYQSAAASAFYAGGAPSGSTRVVRRRLTRSQWRDRAGFAPDFP